ncbi:glycine cleavage system H protein [Kordiimonas sediminis]|uniref:Glycine cleavage system H protein n=1 Tax=Kordiimonas sediminis TaxID=1735581 RepID=A0A919EAF4_9PROT|nr:glycine cleavage system protein GcvH [Kordiimonas sediminis]GHF30036.1 glycine cleavage system H protein [Kordiimonas sediminis]
MIKYSEDHEWVSVDGDTATIGITDYAQNALGDIVFVELPEVGATFAKGDEVSVVESVKAASEVYAAVSGEVTEINEALEGEPALVNSAPTTDGWFFKVKLSDAGELDDLMGEDAYKSFIEGL